MLVSEKQQSDNYNGLTIVEAHWIILTKHIAN